MIKRISIGALALTMLAGAAQAQIRGQWKTYPAFDNKSLCIVPTPTKTYFLGYAQPYDTSKSDYVDHEAFLYAYDPEADEVVSYGRDNYLSGGPIKCVQYNPVKRYLLLGYNDGSIDLLYDDDSVVTIDAIKHATISTSREPNSITLDIDHGLICVAGNYGYVLIDDETHKVVTSRMYTEPIYAAVRLGDLMVIDTAKGIFSANYNDPLLALDEFKRVADAGVVTKFLPLNNGNMAYADTKKAFKLEFKDNGTATLSQLGNEFSNMRYIVRNRDGYYFCNGGSGRTLDLDGNFKNFATTPDSEWETITGTWDGSEMWQITPRKGLASYRPDGSSWTATRTGLYPNVPNAYRCHNGMTYSSKYGVLINNHEISVEFPTYTLKIPALTSGLKNGVWTSYGYPYTNKDYASSLAEPNGLAIDPDNPDLIYYGSFFNGVQRKNLADPTDVLHLTHPGDPAAKLKGYYKLDDDDPGWKDFFQFAPPAFDRDGNLWMVRNPFNKSMKVYLWPSAARKASDPSKIISWDLSIKGEHNFRVVPLFHSSNKNLVLISSGSYSNTMLIVDTKGTTDPADDTIVTMSDVSDQDGGHIKIKYIYDLYEDPSTGTVWMMGGSGVLTFRPTDAIKDPTRVNRIKVSRNDGTNLADYLLDNVPVYRMTSDGMGRKWFATGGAGIVVTSADGKTIEDEINTSNSPLPDDLVYSLADNQGENTMVFSTRHGLAEFRLAGASVASDANPELKIYPNPVRPDYLGWVTIEDLPDNAVVKICDAFGNLVKELGIAENGMVKWDVTNTEMKRVKSGVYHVFTSSATEGVSDAPKGKILVIN